MFSAHTPPHSRRASAAVLPWIQSWWMVVILVALALLLLGLAAG